MVEEELVLCNIDKQNQFEEKSQAFGYQNLVGEYMLLVAILKLKETDKHHLVGATGTNYGNTKELKVTNFKETMDMFDKEEQGKAVKL